MACEQFANDAFTTLSIAISDVDTTITVTSTVGFPSAPFRIMIDYEVMMVTAVLGNDFTVTRAVEGTNAEFHDINTDVSHIFTNNSIYAFSECRFGTGIRSDLPTPELDGRIYLTQYPGWYLFRENGTTWRSWGPIFQLYETIDFEDETWVWTNLSEGTEPAAGLTDWFGGLILDVDPNNSAGENIRLFTQLVNLQTPIAPPYTVTMAFTPAISPVTQTCCGMVFRDSVTGQFILFRLMYDDTTVPKRDLVISLDKYDDPYTFNSNYSVLSAGTLTSPMIWFQIEDDGVNLSWYFSNDGLNFALFDTRNRTDFLGSGPDDIGIGFGTNNTTGGAGLTIHSWSKV